MILAALRKLLTPPPPPPPAPVPEPFITIPEGNFWGHHVEWTDYSKRTIWGHIDNYSPFFAAPGSGYKRPIFEVGSVIRVKMKNHRYALFRVTKLKWERDPGDMFFGEVADVGWEDEVRAS